MNGRFDRIARWVCRLAVVAAAAACVLAGLHSMRPNRRPPPSRGIIASTARSPARCWRTICPARSRWRASSTAGATSTTTSACSRAIGVKYRAEPVPVGPRGGFPRPTSSARNEQVPKVHRGRSGDDPEGLRLRDRRPRVEQIPMPEWVFADLGRPVEKRNFLYNDMIYPEGQRQNQWGQRPGARRQPAGDAALVLLPGRLVHRHRLRGHPLRPGGDHERQRPRQMPSGSQCSRWSGPMRPSTPAGTWSCATATTPSGGLVRDGRLLLDFHAFPLRIKENPEQAAGCDPGAGLLRRHLQQEQGRR